MVCISAQSISFLKDNFYERKSNLSGEHSPGLLQYELHFTELKRNALYMTIVKKKSTIRLCGYLHVHCMIHINKYNEK